MKFFDKFKKSKKDKIINKLDKIRPDIINDIVTFTINKVNEGELLMTEDSPQGLKAYPINSSDIKELVFSQYISIFGEKGFNKDARDALTEYTEKLCSSDELALLLGEKYSEDYHKWEDEYYKDADSIEEEMWNFEIKGELKYKGFIETAAEKGDEYKGHINYDITPNLMEHEQKLIPYIEHEENPNEVVNLEDGSIELEELL